MAKPPKLKRFSIEEFPDAPEWLEALFVPLNAFLAGVTQALDRRLTKSDNMLVQREGVEKFTTSDLPLVFKNKLPFTPSEVLVTQLNPKAAGASISTPWSHTWRMSDTGEISVSFQGLTAEVEYTARFLFEP